VCHNIEHKSKGQGAVQENNIPQIYSTATQPEAPHHSSKGATNTVQCMPLYCDNQSALVMMKEYAAGIGGRKHVDIAYQFVRNLVMRREILV
jgi:hypothetical protein